jgi:hypothetical protein
MNTKQVLYNAIAAQLEAKKTTAEEYTNEVYNPSTNDLKVTVLEYFEHNIGGFNSFNFTGNNIRLELGSSWYDRVEILIPNTWREEYKDVQIDWNSGNYSTSNKDKKGYLELLNKIYSNFDNISNMFLNEWYPKHRDIENKHVNAWKEYNDLQAALNSLQNEIKQDANDAMKQIGFEIKSFKPVYNLDWEYDDNNERQYKITTRYKVFKLQYGRSQYDDIYINGFKVLGKKGNKYNVEIYREGYDTRIFNVLEKKFELFVDNASEWENKKADENKAKIEERYKSYQK